MDLKKGLLSLIWLVIVILTVTYVTVFSVYLYGVYSDRSIDLSAEHFRLFFGQFFVSNLQSFTIIFVTFRVGLYVSEKGIRKLEKKTHDHLKKRWELEKRYLIDSYALSLAVFALLLFPIFSQYPECGGYSVLPFALCGVFLFLHDYMLDQYDVALYHLRNFVKDTSDLSSLNRALLIMNRILGRPSKDRRIWDLSHGIGYVVDFGKYAEMKPKIEELTKAIKKEEDSEISRSLLDVSKTCGDLLKEYRLNLGIEPKLPLRYRMVDLTKSVLKSTLEKLLPFVLLVVVLILIYPFVRDFVPSELLKEILDLVSP